MGRKEQEKFIVRYYEIFIVLLATNIIEREVRKRLLISSKGSEWTQIRLQKHCLKKWKDHQRYSLAERTINKLIRKDNSKEQWVKCRWKCNRRWKY